MGKTTPGGRRTPVIVAATCLALVLLPAAWVVVGRIALNRRSRFLNERTHAGYRRVREMEGDRPVLFGTPVPGKAWDEYEKALGMLDDCPDDFAYDEFVQMSPPLPPTDFNKFVADHAVALEHLRAGACRINGKLPFDWVPGDPPRIPGMGVVMLSPLALWQARYLLEQGRELEAAEDLLAACQFGADLSRNTRLGELEIASWGIQDAFGEMESILYEGRMGVEAARMIDTGLEALDQSFPRAYRAFLCERVYQGLIMEGDEHSPPGPHPWGGLRGSWRVPDDSREWSLERWVDHLETIDTFLEDAGEIDTLRGAEYEALHRRWEGRRLNAEFPDWWLDKEKELRNLHTRLRVIRAAAHWRATGQVPSLEDPFGDTIRHAVTDTAVTFWSAGADGVGDGWDITLVLKRKPPKDGRR